MSEKRIEVPLITGAKYNKRFYKAGESIHILPTEIDALIKDGVIRRDDVPEFDEADVSLEEMKLPALKAYAKENNIDLGEASKKDEVLAVIQEAIHEAEKAKEDE
ncbi:hypothetical protein [Paenibacillus wynnii]|uniref:hypothetical protein n=1 Tax=Paenibacillus wynnii TaxID=268407 RepID=UPI000AB3FBAC|nr:hypothetical protein [Paenibacillus wynnii]